MILVGDTVTTKNDVFSDTEYDKSGAKNIGKETFKVSKICPWEGGRLVYGECSDKRQCTIWHRIEDVYKTTGIKTPTLK